MSSVNPIIVNEDEWELVNDDGFVYKRKKRPREPTTTATAPPPPDPALEEKNRRQRKKRALSKLKDKYQVELSQWEHLSNTLKDMELKSQSLQQTRQEHASPLPSDQPSSSSTPDSINRKTIAELLRQVEAQEVIIEDVSNLCDIAEALCSAQEEKSKQVFTELPIWEASPRELMASLCED